MDRPKSEDEQERVVCLDAGTGKQLWQFTYAALYKDLDYGSGPRASPTVHGGRVYTLGAVGTALCLDAATGKCLWQRNLTEGLNAAIPTWCLAASPVIWKDLVILHCGARPDGSFVAVDAVTGREIWRACPDPAGYCTPILANAAGMTQLIGWTPENVVGLDPDRGSLLWQVPYKVTYGVSIATPIFQDGHALVTGYWEGTKAVRLGPKPTDANLEWENLTEIQGLMSQPLYRQGLVYCLDRDRGLTCFEMTTGKIRWYDRHKMTPAGRNPHASMIWIGHEDRALILNAEGYLILARFTPDGYVELSRTRICGPTWAHPAFAGNRVYARTDEELICVEMTGS
jgi:outer membrane protein assembly factor BamB